MIVYRVTKAIYADTALQGARGRGRWHPASTPMVYAADAPATAVLETLVHVERTDLLATPYVLFRITLDPDQHLLRVPPAMLPNDWQAWPWASSTQAIGSFWFTQQTSVALQVPSAVLPTQYNYLLNPQHPDFASLSIDGPEPLPIDSRLG